MDDMTLQAELDRRLRMTPADRATLASGVLPDRYAKSASNLGCMTWAAAAFGAGAGAIFGLNVHPAVASFVPLDAKAFAIACAAAGGFASWVFFRRRFGRLMDKVGERLRSGRVLHATVHARLEEQEVGDSSLVVLVADDGRDFQCPPGLRGLALDRRVRVYFLDFSDLGADGGDLASPTKLPRYVVALEPA